VLARFTGAIEQVPPMHSALKRDGRPLYDYARAGIALELAPRPVVIHALDIVGPETADVSDCWSLDVRCSKGTYIRALARDLGEALGCGAHLAGLRRTGSGSFDVRDALSLEALEALDEPGRQARLLPPDALVAAWPSLCLDAAEADRFRHGLRRRIARPDAGAVRVYGPGEREFLGSGRVLDGELLATRLLSPDEVASLCGAPV
jgi:tRNA pseudouridine55 synthase